MKRLLALAGLGAVIGALGLFAAVALAYQDDPTDHKVVICHASASVTNPYQTPDVDKDSIQNTEGLDANGHGTHTGPIFDPETNENGDNWGDIIPPFAAGYLAGPPAKAWGAFAGLNWTDEGRAIWENGCNIPATPEDTPVTPTAPTFQDPTCDVVAAVNLPTVTGVTYAVEGTVAPGHKVTVKATAKDGYVLTGTDEWKHTFGDVPDNCTPPPPPPIQVTPGVAFQDPTCDVGAAVVPTTTTGITYTIDGNVAPGEKVTVSASANDGYTIIGNATWEHTFGHVPSNCAATLPTETTPTTPAAPLTPPTTTTKPAKPATKPTVKPATKPAAKTAPKKAVAGAYVEKKPTLAYTP
jgi:hypothetical protein